MHGAFAIEMMRLGRVALGCPPAGNQWLPVALAAAVAFVVALSVVAAALRTGMNDAQRSILVLLMAALAPLAAAAAATILFARTASPVPAAAIAPCAAVAALFLIVAPAARQVLRTTYAKALTALMLSLLLAVVVSRLLGAALDAVRSGERGVDKTRARTKLMNEFLSR